MVTVRDLLRVLPDISVCAGDGGLNRTIQTISFIDAPSSVDWLNGGEVILTTAFLYKENAEMQLKFVQKLIDMGVVALGIKIGRYIEEIPDTIIALANQNTFPIFRIGFDTVWSEIFSAFHTLRLDKKDKQSILSTEIVAFDKLFRSSTWDSEAIRSYFLKCISVPAIITDMGYEILCKDVGDDNEGLKTAESYCEKMRTNPTPEKNPAYFITHAKQGRKLFDHILYPNERIVLCSKNGDIQQAEIEWISALYKTIREKNRFMQDAPTLWKNFIKECLIGDSKENMVDYIRILNLRDGGLKVLLVLSGAMAEAVSNELRQRLRTSISRREAMIHCATMESGDIIMLYGVPACMEHYQFTNTLRAMLQWALVNYPDVKVRVGMPVTSSDDIKLSYQCARAASYLGDRLFPDDNLIFYEDIRAIDILRNSNYDFSEIEYLNKTITSFNACKTLETFLECGNIKRAAECSFIHDNTMRYRIQKIEQLLNMDLRRPLTRVSLLLKLKLWYLSQN